jgi:hypothetical protein
MTNFAAYTDASLSALTFNPKFDDQIARKQEILTGVYRTENLEPNTILFVGFNPATVSCRAKNIFVTEISDTAMKFLTDQRVKFTYIPPAKLQDYRKHFDCVVAMDEYFTFADSDEEQQGKIAQLCNLAQAFVISTVKDYKNMDYKDRDFSQPVLVRNGNAHKMFVENCMWNMTDRTLFTSMLYEISEPNSVLTSYGLFNRRTMYFKQLAKFSMDNGAANLLVHKNLMYKALTKRNYEHVVSIQFE